MALLLFAVGIVLLVGGAELLVRGASRLAAAFGVSPLVIGLTVVAFGTSAPELAVSVQAAFSSGADIALGNVVGSNIANVLLILGLSAAIAPLAVAQQLVWMEVPILVGISALLFVLSLNGTVDRLDGVLYVALAILHTVFIVWRSQRETKAVEEEYAHAYGAGTPRTLRQALAQLALVVAGLAALVLGSRWLVEGAVTFARFLGVSELIIGLTVVALGTSLPEVATSLLASLRGERDIAVGNVIGSCIFNILVVLGISSAAAPTGISVPAAALAFDLPVLLVVAVACLPVFYTGHRIDRWEGVVFLVYYVAYTLYLLLDAAEHDVLPMFSSTLLVFALPLTAVTLLVLAFRQAADSRRSTKSA